MVSLAGIPVACRSSTSMRDSPYIAVNTVDGRDPKQPPGMVQKPCK